MGDEEFWFQVGMQELASLSTVGLAQRIGTMAATPSPWRTYAAEQEPKTYGPHLKVDMYELNYIQDRMYDLQNSGRMESHEYITLAATYEKMHDFSNLNYLNCWWPDDELIYTWEPRGDDGE